MRKLLFIITLSVIIFSSSIVLSNSVFAQSNQAANSSEPDCVYALLGNLISAKSRSCQDTGTPTVLSDAFGHVGPTNGFLLYDEKLYFNNILHRGGPCMTPECPNELTATDEEKAKACQYDNNGNFWYPLSDAQKRVLMDMQANYSVFVCPATGKSTPPSPPTGHTTVTYSGTVNVMNIGKNNTQPNATKSVSVETSIQKTSQVSQKVELSPLKQIKSGTALKDIICKEGFVLIIKESNEYPACVKPSTGTKLLAHGWLTIGNFETKIKS